MSQPASNDDFGNGGGVRAVWDQQATNVAGYTNLDGYPIQLFRRDLPSGAITPIPPATRDPLSSALTRNTVPTTDTVMSLV